MLYMTPTQPNCSSQKHRSYLWFLFPLPLPHLAYHWVLLPTSTYRKYPDTTPPLSISTAAIQIPNLSLTQSIMMGFHQFFVSTTITYHIFSPKQSKGSCNHAIPFPCLKTSKCLDFKFLGMAAQTLCIQVLSPFRAQLIPLHLFTLL